MTGQEGLEPGRAGAREADGSSPSPGPEVPVRREGRGCGYAHQGELQSAQGRLHAALTALARDPHDDARVLGARMAEGAAALLVELAGRAETRSVEARRLARRAARREEQAAGVPAGAPRAPYCPEIEEALAHSARMIALGRKLLDEAP